MSSPAPTAGLPATISPAAPKAPVATRGPYMNQATALARKVQLCEAYHKVQDEYSKRSRAEKTRAGGMRLFWEENERETAHKRHGLAIPFTTWRSFYQRGSWHQDPNKFLNLAGGQPLLGRTAEVALMAFIIGMCALGFLLSPSEVKDFLLSQGASFPSTADTPHDRPAAFVSAKFR